MSADEDLSTWFDHLNQLLGCVRNVRTDLPADLPQFFCAALPAAPPFSDIEKNTIRQCMSDTPVMPSLDDFAQAATFGALIDRRAPLKPRILEVMKKKAIEEFDTALPILLQKRPDVLAESKASAMDRTPNDELKTCVAGPIRLHGAANTGG